MKFPTFHRSWKPHLHTRGQWAIGMETTLSVFQEGLLTRTAAFNSFLLTASLFPSYACLNSSVFPGMIKIANIQCLDEQKAA